MIKLSERQPSISEPLLGHPEHSSSDVSSTTAAKSQEHESGSRRRWSALQDLGLPSDVLAAVIEAFFNCFHNQPYSFFHEQSFRRRLVEQDVPIHVVLAILAIALRFCTHPYFAGRIHEASVGYATKAWSYIVSDCFSSGQAADVSTVQTTALLGLFDFTGKCNVRLGTK